MARSEIDAGKLQVLPLLVDLRDTEMALRQQLKELGVDAMEKMVASKKRKSKGAFSDDENNECESCRMILFVSQVHVSVFGVLPCALARRKITWNVCSQVTNSNDLSYYCLRHAVSLLMKKPAQAKHCQLSYLYSEVEILYRVRTMCWFGYATNEFFGWLVDDRRSSEN